MSFSTLHDKILSHHRAGVDIPTIKVRFEHLTVQAQVHVGKRALPTITNYMLDLVEVSSNMKRRARGRALTCPSFRSFYWSNV